MVKMKNPVVELMCDVDNGRKVRLVRSLCRTYEGKTMWAPIGFVSDLASIPRVLWNIYPPYGKYSGEAIFHDYLYKHHILSKKDADKMLAENMVAMGCRGIVARGFYYAVRTCGSKHYNRGNKV